MLREDDKERPVEKVNAITGIRKKIEDDRLFFIRSLLMENAGRKYHAPAAIVAARKPNR